MTQTVKPVETKTIQTTAPAQSIVLTPCFETLLKAYADAYHKAECALLAGVGDSAQDKADTRATDALNSLTAYIDRFFVK